jgi:hypothetical protein
MVSGITVTPRRYSRVVGRSRASSPEVNETSGEAMTVDEDRMRLRTRLEEWAWVVPTS